MKPDQRIDGFGASSAWTAPDMTPSDPATTLAFSQDAGAGLSLLRIRIAPCTVAVDGSCDEYTLETTTAQTAQAMGVKVWATPWTPPAAWKSNDSTQDGGTLLSADEDNWANALVGFVQSMQSKGVNLVGVSAQNEPTEDVAYDSCLYTPDTLAEFVGNHLGPAMQDAGLLGDGGMPFGIIAPETVQGDSNFSAFSSQILSTNAASYVGTIATHSYGEGPPHDPAVAQAGKEYWETEVYDQEDVVPLDAGAGPLAAAELSSALWVATTVNTAMVTGGVNAWHYWWLYGGTGGNEGLFDMSLGGGNAMTDEVVDASADATVTNYNAGPVALPTKRLYALGNYSRFVRPGFFRVNATQYPANNVYVSAFYDAPSEQVVVVAVNTNQAGDGGPGTVPITFLFDSVSTGSWTSWVTSASQNLEPGDPVTGSASVTYTLQPRSVTTLHGSVTGPGAAVSADAGTSVAVVGVLGTDGGVVSGDLSVGTAGSGCGLACSAVGRTSNRQGPWHLAAAGLSFGACVLARWRTRRRRAWSRVGRASSGVTGRAAQPGFREG